MRGSEPGTPATRTENRIRAHNVCGRISNDELIWSAIDNTNTARGVQKRHMEAMVKNVSSAVELLAAAAHSDTVEQWDGEALSRAFHWARYCEHVHHRYHNNTTIRMVVEEQLGLTNRSLREVFPEYTALCFSDLSCCQHLLLNGLLHNSEVPMSIMKILFESPGHVNKELNAYRDLAGLCSSIIKYKSASKVLGRVTEASTSRAEAEVQANLLMEKLVKQSNRGQQVEQFLDWVFQGCEEAGEHFCLVIAAALLSKTNSQTDFILDQLELKHSLLEHMCHSLPTSLLADVANRDVKFRHMYIDVLKKWGTDMEYDINKSEWFQMSRNPSVSFQKLTEHFVSLFKACIPLKGCVEAELKALKYSDGDFDVRGLSVWGDLLSEIHKEMSLFQSQQNH